MEKKKLCIWIIVAVIAVAVLAAIAAVLAVVLSRSSKQPQAAGTSLDDSISTHATFPNGSYLVSVQSLKPGPPGMAPPQLNGSELAHMGIRVDNSSLVAETGRLSYFYIAIPPLSSANKSIQKRSPVQEDSSLGNIGVRFGNANTINVVPLSLANVPRSGLRLLGQLPDSNAAVYELQVRMPDSMCSGESSGTCTEINWDGYWISSDNGTGSASDFSTSLHVACGSQCDAAANSPCATSSCQTCDGEQVAGADTPVTRRYNLGTTSAKLDFQYETFVVEDRVTVLYEGQYLVDSGCVGTDGPRTQTISFNGKSQELRVDVEPNCEGTTSTGWWFQLPCASPCSSPNSRNNGVTLLNGKKQVTDGSITYITEDAQMPSLFACSGSSSTTMQWTFEISKDLSGKAVWCNETKTYSGSGSQWDISQAMGNDVQGGDVTLSWTDNQQNSGSLNFKILGTNPDTNPIVNAIVSSTTLWYAKYIAIQESKLQQFLSDGYPIPSSDGFHGYGIFQLTKPAPTCIQLWSWKENVAEGVSRIKKASDTAHSWMYGPYCDHGIKKDGQRQQAEHEENHKVPVPDHKEVNTTCVFKENSARVIEDAIAMKIYNSATYMYCQWHNRQGQVAGYWFFNTKDLQGRNYVNAVCTHVP